MFRRFFETVKDEYISLKEGVLEISQGYCFGRDLADDVRQRVEFVARGEVDPSNGMALVLQLGEYKLAWEDLISQEETPFHSLGMALYGAIHRKDDKMMADLWKHLNSNVRDSKGLSELEDPNMELLG